MLPARMRASLVKTWIKGEQDLALTNVFLQIAICYLSHPNITTIQFSHFLSMKLSLLHPMKMYFCCDKRGRESEDLPIECC